MATMHPPMKWAEREDKVYLTIELQDAREVTIDIAGDGFVFSAIGPDGTSYAETLKLHKAVSKEKSTYATTGRSVFVVLMKEDAEWWERLVAKTEPKPANLKVDFDRWADEDDAAGDVDVSGFDMQSMMGGMGGMGGMGDMGGMGGMGGGMGGEGMPPGMGDPASMKQLQDLIANMKSNEAPTDAKKKNSPFLTPVEEEEEDDDLPELVP